MDDITLDRQDSSNAFEPETAKTNDSTTFSKVIDKNDDERSKNCALSMC